MKKQLLNPTLILTGAAAIALLAGCASPGYTEVTGPRSALAFTTVTRPNDLIRWTGDRYMEMSLRSIDTYYFQVPDTGYRPGGVEETVMTTPATTVVTPGAEVTTPAGPVVAPSAEVTASAGAPGPYQTETGGYKVIEYRPGHAR